MPHPRTTAPYAAHGAWFVRRYPLAAFTGLAFGIGWPLLALLARARRGHGEGGGVVLGQPAEHWLALGLVALILMPTALVVTRAADGAAGVRALVRRAFRWRIGVGWAVAATLGLPTIALALALLAGGRLRADADASLLLDYAMSVASRTAIINLWEELVWAGFLQTRLQHRHGVIVAALLTAVPFAAIHVPLGLISEDPLLPMFAGLLILSIVFRLLLGVVLAGTGGSVLAVGVTHAAFNATANADGFLQAAIAGGDTAWPALAAAVVLAALLASRVIARARAKRGERLSE